jgi:hypothetical protein
MTTQSEFQCPRCQALTWARGKPPKPDAFIKRVPACHKCGYPVTNATGKTRRHYSLQELL